MSMTEARSRLANGVKRAKRDPHDELIKQQVEDARRDLAAAKLDAYCQTVLASCPPLSEDQKQRLVLLLRATP